MSTPYTLIATRCGGCGDAMTISLHPDDEFEDGMAICSCCNEDIFDSYLDGILPELAQAEAVAFRARNDREAA